MSREKSMTPRKFRSLMQARFSSHLTFEGSLGVASGEHDGDGAGLDEPVLELGSAYENQPIRGRHSMYWYHSLCRP